MDKIKGKFEGASPLQKPLLPLSFEGEGDKGGEVENKYQYRGMPIGEGGLGNERIHRTDADGGSGNHINPWRVRVGATISPPCATISPPYSTA